MSWRPQSQREWIGLALAFVTLIVYANNVFSQQFLCDDAYISFRYAEHLSIGEGLVWNVGERVEGFTNFLWVLWLAFTMKFGLDPATVALASGALSGAVVLAATVILSTGSKRWPDPLAFVAPLCLASNRSFAAWASGGLETMAFAAMLMLGWVAYRYEADATQRRLWPSALIFGFAFWLRPEAALFGLVVAVGVSLAALRGRLSTRGWIGWLLCWSLPMVTLSLFRWHYFGSWLPNTFAAKVPGLWWEQGFNYLSLAARAFAPLWLAPLAVAALWLRRSRIERALLISICLYLLYVAAVGGDRFEFRFLVPILAPFYWLVGVTLRELIERRSVIAKPLALSGAVLVIFLAASGKSVLPAGDEAQGVASLERIADYAVRRAEEGRFLRRQIDAGRLPQDWTICVGGAGAVPYLTQWKTIDRRGLNDRYIASQPLLKRGVVAHEREIPYDYMLQRGVVVFDAFNRLVHDYDPFRGQRATFRHDGQELQIIVIPIEDRFMVFATPLRGAAIDETFPQAIMR